MTSHGAPVPCESCGRTIGARSTHVRYRQTGNIYCIACVTTSGRHGEEFPDCPDQWHDGWDHEPQLCTRAAANKLRAA